MEMKKLVALWAVALAAALGQSVLWAQKKPLDHDVYDSWQSVSGVKMSDNGKVLVWNVNPQEGDGTLYVRAISGAANTGKADNEGKAANTGKTDSRCHCYSTQLQRQYIDSHWLQTC